MSDVRGNRRRRGLAWWAGLTAGLAVLVLGGLSLFYWVWDHAPASLYWQVGLAFLLALECVYGVAVAAAAVAAPVLGVVVLRARTRRLRAARGLLLCASVLIGAALVESAAAVVRRAAHRRSAVVAGAIEEPFVTAVNPEEIALPTTFPPSPEGDSTINLIVVGGSSAEGVPYNFWVSVGGIVAWQLRAAIPSRPVHMEVVAESGQTLETQQRRLADLKRRPDIVLIYCGHNEFSARFPSSRAPRYYHDERPPSAWERLVARVESASPFCGLIAETAEKCRIAVPPPPESLRSLVDVPVYTADEYAALLADFRRRLDQIVAWSERFGALTVLIVPPANDSGFDPNRSFLAAETPYAERLAFERDFLAARRLEAVDPTTSAARYRALLARQPGFAEAHYRLARLLERAGVWDEAYAHDVAARDNDGMPMRCLTPFQDAYRDVAAQHPCLLIDGQSYFHTIGNHGLLDENLFHDGMHPSLRGQIALAQAVLQGLRARRAFGWPEDAPVSALDPAQVANHFRLGSYEWQRVSLWGVMFYDRTRAVRYERSARGAKQDAFGRAHNRIAAGAAPEAVGLPNIGIPPPVPLVPGAAVWTGPGTPAGP